MCAREIRDISGSKSNIKQPTVCKMLNQTCFPKDPATLAAVKAWMAEKSKVKKIQKDE